MRGIGLHPEKLADQTIDVVFSKQCSIFRMNAGGCSEQDTAYDKGTRHKWLIVECEADDVRAL